MLAIRGACRPAVFGQASCSVKQICSEADLPQIAMMRQTFFWGPNVGPARVDPAVAEAHSDAHTALASWHNPYF